MQQQQQQHMKHSAAGQQVASSSSTTISGSQPQVSVADYPDGQQHLRQTPFERLKQQQQQQRRDQLQQPQGSDVEPDRVLSPFVRLQQQLLTDQQQQQRHTSLQPDQVEQLQQQQQQGWHLPFISKHKRQQQQQQQHGPNPRPSLGHLLLSPLRYQAQDFQLQLQQQQQQLPDASPVSPQRQRPDQGQQGLVHLKDLEHAMMTVQHNARRMQVAHLTAAEKKQVDLMAARTIGQALVQQAQQRRDATQIALADQQADAAIQRAMQAVAAAAAAAVNGGASTAVVEPQQASSGTYAAAESPSQDDLIAAADAAAAAAAAAAAVMHSDPNASAKAAVDLPAADSCVARGACATAQDIPAANNCSNLHLHPELEVNTGHSATAGRAAAAAAAAAPAGVDLSSRSRGSTYAPAGDDEVSCFSANLLMLQQSHAAAPCHPQASTAAATAAAPAAYSQQQVGNQYDPADECGLSQQVLNTAADVSTALRAATASPAAAYANEASHMSAAHSSSMTDHRPGPWSTRAEAQQSSDSRGPVGSQRSTVSAVQPRAAQAPSRHPQQQRPVAASVVEQEPFEQHFAGNLQTHASTPVVSAAAARQPQQQRQQQQQLDLLQRYIHDQQEEQHRIASLLQQQQAQLDQWQQQQQQGLPMALASQQRQPRQPTKECSLTANLAQHNSHDGIVAPAPPYPNANTSTSMHVPVQPVLQLGAKKCSDRGVLAHPTGAQPHVVGSGEGSRQPLKAVDNGAADAAKAAPGMAVVSARGSSSSSSEDSEVLNASTGLRAGVGRTLQRLNAAKYSRG